MNLLTYTLKNKIMKTFERTHLPETVKYNGEIYTYNATITAGMNQSNTRPENVIKALKTTGKKGILVNVLQTNLKGVRDLRGNYYQPRPNIYTT